MNEASVGVIVGAILFFLVLIIVIVLTFATIHSKKHDCHLEIKPLGLIFDIKCHDKQP